MGEAAQTEVERDPVDRTGEALAAAAILGIAMLASAWSAYQASLWDGIQAFRLAAASSGGPEGGESLGDRRPAARPGRGLLPAVRRRVEQGEETGGESGSSSSSGLSLQAATRAWLAGNPAAAGTPL